MTSQNGFIGLVACLFLFCVGAVGMVVMSYPAQTRANGPAPAPVTQCYVHANPAQFSVWAVHAAIEGCKRERKAKV